MIKLLLQVPNIITPASAIAAQVGEGPGATGTIGFIVLAIILGPVLLLTIAAIFGAPRTFRVPALFIGSFILLVGAIVSSFAAVGLLLGFIIPQ